MDLTLRLYNTPNVEYPLLNAYMMAPEAMYPSLEEAIAKSPKPKYSKYFGVSKPKSKTPYEASIRYMNRQISLGTFFDEEEAARVYDRASLWISEKGLRKYRTNFNFDKKDYDAELVELLKHDTFEDLVKMIRPSSKNNAIPMSQYIGVSIHNKTGQISAYIRHHGKTANFGTFPTELDAAKTYDLAALWIQHKNARTVAIQTNFQPLVYATQMVELIKIDDFDQFRDTLRTFARLLRKKAKTEQ